MPVRVVGVEHRLHAALPGAQAERAAADDLLVEFRVADAFDIGARHDGQLDELGHQRGVGCLGADRHLRGAGDFGAGDLIELAQLRAFEGWVDDAADAEDDVVGCEFAAVVEDDVGAQVEHDGGVVGVAPGGGNLRNDFAGDIPGHEIVEDVAVDGVAVGIPLEVGVHGRDVAGEIDDEGLLRLGVRRRKREEGGQQLQGQGEAAHGRGSWGLMGAAWWRRIGRLAIR